MATCSGCGAQIIWIQTQRGKKMPCDPKPVPYWAKEKAPGKVVTPAGALVSCEFTGDLATATGVGYIPHWATCPKSKAFKKR